jgi:hypothetical protein
MSGDYTRFSFDPTKGFSGVHEQQGRVSLDSDANEFEEILDRRDRSEMYDTVGAAVVPATTPTGFEIGVSGSSLTIGIGRVYVDGIQAECFGDLSDPKATVFEPRVGSVVGNLPLLFDQQPFLYQPNFPGLPSASGITSLVYLDVWQREVTVWEDRSLLEPALGGPDTATRIQTAWQVKSLAGVAGGDCTLPTALIAPSTARMTAIAAPAPPAPGPCVIAPAGGYTGLENRLYRVEVQHAGTLAGPNPATIKWSRDNASLVASVLKVTADGTGSIITVESTGRDTWMRFEVGQQLELLDDWVEFAMRESGVAGEIARITNINHATGEIRIDQDFSAFAILATRHPRVRRWDTAKPADPAVVAVNNGTPIALEHGIFITFGDLLAGTLHDGDTLHAGDYWVFAARTADGSIEAVLNEPPRGILHHFMPLAIVTSGNPPIVDSDCRDPWPVLCNCEGGGCECDACVSVESHTSGSLTIQMAVDQVVAAGGGTVCIGVGTFPLEKTVLIENAVSLRVRGAGLATILWYRGQDPALVVRSSLDVIVRDLAVITERERSQPQDAVEVIDAALIILERLVVIEDPIAIIEFLDAGTVMRASGGAIGLGGFILRTTVRDCVLAGGIGILSRPNLTKEPDDYLVTADLLIEHDLIFATAFGVWLGSPEESGAVHFLDRTQIADCSIYGCEQVGIMLAGTVTQGFIDVRDGRLGVIGRGIQLSTDLTTVADTTMSAWRDAELQFGVSVVRGDRDIVRDVRIVGNRIDHFRGGGVEIDTSVDNLAVEDNTVRRCGNGIVMGLKSSGDTVTVARNTILDVESRGRQEGRFGVCLVRTIDGLVTDNTIKRVATADIGTPWRAGIQTVACGAVRIAGNVIEEVGPIEAGQPSFGIAAAESFERLDIVDNTVRPNVERTITDWFALFIGDFSKVSKTYGILVGSKLYYAVGLSIHVLAVNDRGGSLAVRGNHLDAAGRSAVVHVETNSAATFADNWCRLLVEPDKAPVVELYQPILAFATNQVRQLRGGDRPAVEVKVGPAPVPSPPNLAFSALGNLTDGMIFVNGSPLPPPWDGLNVRLT